MSVGFTLRQDKSLTEAKEAKDQSLGKIVSKEIENSPQYKDAANSAREYLESHDILNFVQCLLQSVIRDKPADPYLFMAKQMYTPESQGPSRCATPLQANLESPTRATTPAPIPPRVPEEAKPAEVPQEDVKPAPNEDV